MKCVVVGAAGFIGTHLVQRLSRAGHGVVGYDAPAAVAGAPEVRAWDVVRDAAAFEPCDVVWYLAQSPHYREFPRGGDDLFGVNVVGALRAAAAARDAGARAFVYTSTGSVYAPSFAPLAEHAPVRRDDAYALSKLTAEAALALVPGPLRAICVRLFGVFGPGQKTMLVPAIAARVREGRAVTIERRPDDPGDDGGLRISLTYVDDVTACLVQLGERALAAPDAVPALLNVASPEAVSVRDLAEAIGERLGRRAVFESVDKARASDFIADVSRLRALLEPRFTPFRTAIAATFAGRAE